MSTGTPTRTRNAADSRQRLLEAAYDLFSERGYGRTTIREIGARAGVDPALIARYFGSKAHLYLATLQRLDHARPTVPVDLSDPESVAALLHRISPRGPTPTLYAAVTPHEDAELQAAATGVLEERFVFPSERAAARAGRPEARLRAEIVAAALAGVLLSRSAGTFPDLAQASIDQVAEVLAEMFGAALNA